MASNEGPKTSHLTIQKERTFINHLQCAKDSQRSAEPANKMKKWMVLIMAFMSVAVATGFPFNMSVLYVEWLEEFKKSNSETALVQSVCTGIFSLGGKIYQITFINHI